VSVIFSTCFALSARASRGSPFGSDRRLLSPEEARESHPGNRFGAVSDLPLDLFDEPARRTELRSLATQRSRELLDAAECPLCKILQIKRIDNAMNTD